MMRAAPPGSLYMSGNATPPSQPFKRVERGRVAQDDSVHAKLRLENAGCDREWARRAVYALQMKPGQGQFCMMVGLEFCPKAPHIGVGTILGYECSSCDCAAKSAFSLCALDQAEASALRLPSSTPRLISAITDGRTCLLSPDPARSMIAVRRQFIDHVVAGHLGPAQDRVPRHAPNGRQYGFVQVCH